MMTLESRYGELKAAIHYNPFDNMFHATLLGGMFSNCHGQGPTIDQALVSLKLTVNAKFRSLQEEVSEADAFLSTAMES